jgi:anaerobic selenocysteine-containing dehydrogenase
MEEQTFRETDKEKSFIKGLGLNGFGSNGNISVVDVKNNRLVRIRPLHYDWRYDKKAFNSWKMEAHGQVFEPGMKTLIPSFEMAYRKRVYSPNRVLFPLKRVDWDPKGERNTSKRGTSKYQRISWEEALDIIVNEINRVRSQYGPEAILAQADGHGEGKALQTAHGAQCNLLSLLGGYTLQIRNPDSWEGWYWGAKHAWGMEPQGQMGPRANIMPDIAENSQLLLFWGCDPEVTPLGFNGQMASRLCYWWTELGIKSIYICPDLNYGAAVHADKWIPIKPCTDAALQLAIAYVWIKEDIYDKSYVASHTYGFEKFEEYVLGKEDGIPKTPEWASSKCGIPEWTIKALAREWASKRTTITHGNGGPGIRGPYSTENGRLEVLLLGMQGLGKPGVHQVKMLEWGSRPIWGKSSNPMPRGILSSLTMRTPETLSSSEVNYKKYYDVLSPQRASASEAANNNVNMKPEKAQPEPQKVVSTTPKQIIPKDLIHDAILHPPISWYGNGSFLSPLEDQFVKHTYPVEGCSEVHMIWTDSPCWITCWNDSNSYIKALRSSKIEFILAQHPWLENDCLFADLILPVSTKFEEEDIGVDVANGQFFLAIREKTCIEPLGESKSDDEIVSLIAEKMNLLKEYSGG